MDNNHSTNEQPPPLPTFSLGKLFLFVTCACVGALGLRIIGPREYLVGRLSVAFLLMGVFLGAWAIATRQRRLVKIAGVVFLLGTVLALCIPVGGSTGPSSRRSQCTNNLRQIGLALQAYEQKYGSFPPAYVADSSGKPLVSWRVLILPFLEESTLASAIHQNEAWDSPNNRKSTATPLLVFQCPSDPVAAVGASGLCNYFAVVGPNAAWAGANPRKLSDFKDPRHTILVVEIENSGVHWAEPRDLYVGQMATVINPATRQGISSAHHGGANVLFADGHVEFLPDSTDPKALAATLDIRGEPGTEHTP